MTHAEFIRDGLPDTFDNTMRTTFKQCPRKYYWWRRGFDYAQKPAYFAWGGAWGRILNAWYSSPGPFGTSPARFAQEALNEGLDYWDSQGCPDDYTNKRSSLIELWKLYQRTYPQEPWTLIAGEVGWKWPLRGTPWFLGGALDGYISWHPYGTLVLENKTAGVWLSDNYLRQWSFSPQVTGYIWAITRMRGEEIFGCLMNITCKRISKAGKTPQFARPLEKRSLDWLDEFENDWLMDILLLKWYYDEAHFPMTTDPINCTGGIGKSPCLYQPLCLDPRPLNVINPLLWPNIREKEEFWEPWNREGED